MHELARVQVDEFAAPREQLRPSSCPVGLAAVRAAARGEDHEAAALIAEIERTALSALDCVLALLARAILLGIDGQTAAARAELARALRVAVAAAVDPGLVTRVVRGLGDVVVVTGPALRRLSRSEALAGLPEGGGPPEGGVLPEGAVPPEGVVIDARSHQIIAHGRMSSIARRPVVRSLLYALARQPSRVLDKEALAAAAWRCAYDPVCHDDALKSNMLHLRRLLAGTGVAIACGNPGYRLDATGRFAFVVPFDLLAPG